MRKIPQKYIITHLITPKTLRNRSSQQSIVPVQQIDSSLHQCDHIIHSLILAYFHHQ